MSKFYVSIVFLLWMNSSMAQTAEKSVLAWQTKINEEYKDKKTSPLDSDKLAAFNGFDFFAFNKKYVVTATLEKYENPKTVKFKTSTPFVMPQYEYGLLSFTIDGEKYTLTIYQSPTHLKEKGLENYLFLPFADETNGLETYGGGRYIDLEIPISGNNIEIDFNKSYNPYCAYSTKYSCPKVPENNTLPIKIFAGIKYGAKH